MRLRVPAPPRMPSTDTDSESSWVRSHPAHEAPAGSLWCSWFRPVCFGVALRLFLFVPGHLPYVHGHICSVPFRPWVSSGPLVSDGMGVNECMVRSVQRPLPLLSARSHTPVAALARSRSPAAAQLTPSFRRALLLPLLLLPSLPPAAAIGPRGRGVT